MSTTTEPKPKHKPVKLVSLVWALLASCALHGGLYFFVFVYLEPPSVDVSLEWPDSVELGLPDANSKAWQQALAALQQNETTVDSNAEDSQEEDPGESAAPATGSDAKEESAENSGEEDPSADDGSEEAQKTKVFSGKDIVDAVGQGSLLQLRFDLAKLRATPFERDVATLLSAIPDWEMLLGRSGIQPTEDLEQLLIASPDFRTRHMVVAGIYNGSQGSIDSIASKVSEEIGRPLNWRRENGIRVTDWPTGDNINRVLAKLSNQYFLIGRQEDIPRVLSILAEEKQRLKARKSKQSGDMLRLGKDQVLRFDANSVRVFVKGSESIIPKAAMLTIGYQHQEAAQVADDEGEGTASEDSTVSIQVLATFDDAKQAKDALTYWQKLQQTYAGNVLVAMSGLGRTLREITMEQSDSTLVIRSKLSERETAQLLRLLNSSLRSQGRNRVRPS